MQKQLANFLQDIDTGGEIEVIPDYSGRGMYGRTTHAVQAPSVEYVMEQLLDAIAEENSALVDIKDMRIEEIRTDSMGMDIVIY